MQDDSELYELGRRQLAYEHSVINLIASDNAKPLGDKRTPYEGHIIQEGILGARPFAGAKIHDEVERLAARIACSVFGADHANLQPHSCSQANQAVYQAVLRPGDPVLALNFQAGGHLTHGLSNNFSGQRYAFSFFGMNIDGTIDYSELETLAHRIKPALVVCGSSACPRLFDVHRMREIADTTGARLMLDLSHEAGLIAGGAIPNPTRYADIVTMSLDKTLRGPYGGAILCRSELANAIDHAVHPGTQSSFPVRKLFEAAAALLQSQRGDFQDYAARTIANAKVFAQKFLERGVPIVSGGTEKHYIILDARPFGLSGKEAEERLERIDILTNRQTLPDDRSRRMNEASGIRLGAAWITSRGYGQSDSIQVADIVFEALSLPQNDKDGMHNLHRKVKQVVVSQRQDDVWNTPIISE